jgi:hypothetical protein
MQKLNCWLVLTLMAEKSKKIRVLIITMSAAAVILAICALWTNWHGIMLSTHSSGTVTDGVLPSVSSDEHIENVPAGEIRYLINKNVYFDSYYSKGNLMFENPESSEYDIKFVIADASGDQIYDSPYIKPGQYLESDKLSKYVKPGVYSCVYHARAYQNGEYCGEVSGSLTVTVSNAS